MCFFFLEIGVSCHTYISDEALFLIKLADMHIRAIELKCYLLSIFRISKIHLVQYKGCIISSNTFIVFRFVYLYIFFSLSFVFV